MGVQLLKLRYASPKNPHGLIPPSPPAERRAEKRRELARLVRYPISGRVLLPGMPQYAECLEAARIGTPGALSGGMSALSGVDTQMLGASGPTFPTGALAHWRFEEAAGGPYADATGNGNTLTATGSPTQETGKVGSYAIGCGAANYATRASSTGVQANGLSGFTLAFWVYIPSSINQGFIAKEGGASGWEYTVDDDNIANQTYFQAINNAQSASHSANIATGRMGLTAWHFVVVGYNPTSDRLFISKDNGTVYTNAEATGGIVASTGTFKVGHDTTDGYNCNARIDSLTIWHRALTATENGDLYNAGNGLDYS